MTSEQPRLLIIDGLNTFYRSYIVDPSISSKGMPIGGCKGFIKQLQKYCREIKPDEIVVVWDGEGGSSRRKSLKKDYKEGRSPVRPENLLRDNEYMSDEDIERNKQWQLVRLFEYLNEMPVKQLLFNNVEADDIIAIAVQHDLYKDYQKVIVSNDKDFYQLLDEQTILYRAATKSYVSRKEIIEQYNIHPSNFALARAVIGDTSDNLPGVYGVGFKTLVKTLPELSGSQEVDIDFLFERCKNPEKKYKIHENILGSREKIELNYKMMQLYSPTVSPSLSEKVKNSLAAPESNFNLTEIRKMMILDGFGQYDWKTLNSHLRRISFYNQREKE